MLAIEIVIKRQPKQGPFGSKSGYSLGRVFIFGTDFQWLDTLVIIHRSPRDEPHDPNLESVPHLFLLLILIIRTRPQCIALLDVFVKINT